MIASIKGNLQSKSLQRIIIDVGGVGFAISIPFSTYQALPAIKNVVFLLIHTHVTDGAITLYGFLTDGERQAFEKLLTISKIGPKSALAILSGISIGELKNAILQKDINKISSIPGIGKKTAERIILELADKKDFLADFKDLPIEFDHSTEEILEDAEAALLKLGYSERQIKITIRNILDKGLPVLTTESIIKEALKLL
jgi:holliday junction DNA helicase RuvA